MLYVVGYRCTCTFHFSSNTLRTSFLTCPKTTKKTIYKNATVKQATINAQRRRRGEEELVEGADGGVLSCDRRTSQRLAKARTPRFLVES